VRTITEVQLVQRLAAEGKSASSIAVATGIPRTTVRRWIRGEVSRAAVPGAAFCPRCGGERHHPEQSADTYAYALGMYLGDGCLLKNPRGVWRLEITLDSRYPSLIAECAEAVQLLMPGNRVAVVDHRPARFNVVRCYSKAWPCLFPQHGPGPKHKRKIALEPWQYELVDAQPERFVRGLIHSDGCRVLNRVNGKAYPRYFFCQVSDDIRGLFCRSLTQLGIRYTRNDHKNVSIARATSVARLDEFVGPKR
jgi:hypothetical protein